VLLFVSLDTSRIRVDLKEQERWRRTLSFAVPSDVMGRELDRTWAMLAKRVKLPGFRKGSAPSPAVERQYGQQVAQETIERVTREAYRAALEERSLRPISEGRIEAADYQPGRALTFRISFDVRPVIDLGQLDGLEVERPTVRVEASDVERTLRRLQEEHAVWLPPPDEGSPGAGDLVTVQIVPIGPSAESATAVGLPWAKRLRLRADTTHRGRYQFVLGEGDAVPDLERAVESLLPGQSGEFVVVDEGAEASELRELELRITLEDRRTRDLPELDDDFARSLGNFDDLNDLRDRVRADLEEEAAARADAVLGQRLLDQALAAHPFDAPRSLVEQYLTSLGEEKSELGPESRRAGLSMRELRAEAEVAVKRALLFDHVADSMGLNATEAEVDARIEEIAALGQVTPDLVRSRLAESNRLDALARDITERKVIAFLRSRSKIVERG
jgi:trigger factor